MSQYSSSAAVVIVALRVNVIPFKIMHLFFSGYVLVEVKKCSSHADIVFIFYPF